MWKWIQAFASPRNFYQTSGKIIPWLMAPFIALSLNTNKKDCCDIIEILLKVVLITIKY
jgi:hypothetical protein